MLHCAHVREFREEKKKAYLSSSLQEEKQKDRIEKALSGFALLESKEREEEVEEREEEEINQNLKRVFFCVDIAEQHEVDDGPTRGMWVWKWVDPVRFLEIGAIRAYLLY